MLRLVVLQVSPPTEAAPTPVAVRAGERHLLAFGKPFSRAQTRSSCPQDLQRTGMPPSVNYDA
ncbi:MAG: hypothetical protein KME30_20885 [Iphinoe sp. HA4291-MV1]|nr:hypothetical protein [Iphinoe sp. HA4291-MV1]